MVDSRDTPDTGSVSSGSNSATRSGSTGSDRSYSRRDHVEERARDAASEVRGAAWHQAQSQFEKQSGVAAEQTEKLAEALRKMSGEFEHQNQMAFSGYASTLANYSDALSRRLRDKDLGTLLREAEDYGRRQPAVLVGGAVAAGFLIARFLRSSNTPSHSPGGDMRPSHRAGEIESRPSGAHTGYAGQDTTTDRPVGRSQTAGEPTAFGDRDPRPTTTGTPGSAQSSDGDHRII